MNEQIQAGDVVLYGGTEFVVDEVKDIYLGQGFIRIANLKGLDRYISTGLLKFVRRSATLPPDCHWVEPGWFIQPDDVNTDGVVAETYGSSWIRCETPFAWIRRNLRHPELQHIKSKAVEAAKILDTMGYGLHAHQMKWAIHKAAKEYAAKLEQIEAKCLEIAQNGGQP